MDKIKTFIFVTGRSAIEATIVLFLVVMVLGGIFGQKADANSAYQFTTTGVGTMATPSLSLNPETAASVIGTIPAGCHNIDIYVTGGPVNWGNSAISSSTIHPNIASGSSKTFTNVIGRNPLIYLRGVQSGTTPTAYITAY
jgi:hypothetical protein